MSREDVYQVSYLVMAHFYGAAAMICTENSHRDVCLLMAAFWAFAWIVVAIFVKKQVSE
jgi:hypothetical protein